MSDENLPGTDTAEPDELIYSVSDGIATITLNRPHLKNAFTLTMIDRWAEVLRSAEADPEVRVVVVTGAGGAFCSGIDLAVLSGIEPTPIARRRMLTEGVHKVARAVLDLSKPLIAAISGVAVGAGLDMALMCDLRFAGRSARLSEGYIRIGLVPGDGGTYLLPRLVGPAKALELLLSGDTVDGVEAERIGMVNRVYDDAVLLDETYAFAGRLAAMSPISTAMIKRAVYQSQNLDLRTNLDLIASHMAVVQSTEDYAEARAAFGERRAPTFVNR
ncbi:Enoyl-CoA hydratase/carnithine racemase [Parafrankia irregularis]|uniref:Enoyl-CoA hydratase/carnithine racemase n=1 Tax=Parafrankia irregularis TaxID=795642 RepID=A0A0S4QUW5_9ACTN|nr:MULTISPECIES: enoyl-CoA hydratase-related protein [Parafrankia]MBE3201884.1 enoyl-CoA hydratase/isomerase family protein [Parafrankia sp. CH37]CUU59531.1 Enoyl-CoA hydratase/carnithine racemase [Parafrankia irregularis]